MAAFIELLRCDEGKQANGGHNRLDKDIEPNPPCGQA
jgi:hypothetical protein